MSTMETMGRTKRPRRSFTKEFKAEVVALVRQPATQRRASLVISI
jgi:transposase-like protein